MNIKEKCFNIYKEAFGQLPDFDEKLFGEGFKYCRYLLIEGEPVAILFALPCFIETENKKRESIYVFAAATASCHRKKGYMTHLLEKVKANFNGIIFLRPATKELIEFYKKSGFKEICALNSTVGLPRVVPSEIMQFLSQGLVTEKGESFTLMYYPSVQENLENLGFVYSME